MKKNLLFVGYYCQEYNIQVFAVKNLPSKKSYFEMWCLSRKIWVFGTEGTIFFFLHNLIGDIVIQAIVLMEEMKYEGSNYLFFPSGVCTCLC